MAEQKDDIILSIRGMCKSFGRNRVLDHINLMFVGAPSWVSWAKMAPVSQP